MISEGIGGDLVSEHRSVIYYHDDKPKFHEIIKVRNSIFILQSIIFVTLLVQVHDDVHVDRSANGRFLRFTSQVYV